MNRRLLIAAPLAAMVLAAGLALGGTAVAASGARGQHAQTAAIAGPGRTASREAVPWSKVGPGWALATYTTATEFAAHPKTGSTTLYLVDPSGGKYVLYSWPHVPAYGGVDLFAWSGDGTRAMLYVAKGTNGNTQQLDQLALHTGKLTKLSLPNSVIPVGYTRPDGLAVLGYRSLNSPSEVQVVRYSLTGALQQVLYTLKTKSDGGSVNTGASSPYNPAGTSLAATVTGLGVTTAGHTVLISNSGGVTRRYSAAGSCLFARWWTASQLLTSNCSAKRLYLTPTGGGQPVALTPATTSSFEHLDNAWLLGSHTYVQEYGPACGTGALAVIRNGHLAGITVPKTTGGPFIVTASTSRLLILAQQCQGSSALDWFNPATKSQVQVLSTNKGQGVIGWVPYYELSRG